METSGWTWGLLHCTTVIAVASPHRFSPPLCDASMIIHGQSAALGRVDRPLQNCSTANRHAPDAQRKQAECMQVPKWSHPPPRAAVRDCMWLNNAALLGRSESSGRPQVLAPSMHNPSQPIANSAPPLGPPSRARDSAHLSCQHMRDADFILLGPPGARLSPTDRGPVVRGF